MLAPQKAALNVINRTTYIIGQGDRGREMWLCRTIIFIVVMCLVTSCDVVVDKNAGGGNSDIGEHIIDNWVLVKTGMTEEDVINLLGNPDKKRMLEKGYEVIYSYGEIVKPCAPYPFGIKADVQFIEGKVAQHEELRSGKDATELLTPNKKAIFDHFPRYVDFRWVPISSNEFDSYRIEVGFFTSRGEWCQSFLENTSVPYYCFVAGGATVYRWRVQGYNKEGNYGAEWSEWQEFEFRQ